jgi:hypothetical protein
VLLLLTPLALLDAGGVGSAMATVGYGLFSLWVFLTALWLLLVGPIPDVVFVRRVVFRAQPTVSPPRPSARSPPSDDRSRRNAQLWER